MPYLVAPKARSSEEVTHAMMVPFALVEIRFALTPFGIVLKRKRLLIKSSTLGVSHSYLSLTLHPSFILNICFFVHDFYLESL